MGDRLEMVRRRDEQCTIGRIGDGWGVACAALFLCSLRQTRPNTLSALSWLLMWSDSQLRLSTAFDTGPFSIFESMSLTAGMMQLDRRGSASLAETSIGILYGRFL